MSAADTVTAARVGTSTPHSTAEIVPEIRDGLARLRPLGIEHRALYQNAVAASGIVCWSAYMPHLLCTSRPERRILHERVGDVLLVYVLRSDGPRPELRLIVPPLPFDAAALRHAGKRMTMVNRGRRSIEWLDESIALDVVRQGYRIRIRSSEYIYDQAAVAAIEGAPFRRLRSNLAATARHPDLICRPYAREDVAACTALVRQWRERLKRNGMVANGYSYTLRCLETAADYPPDLLRGEVVEIAGTVRGFAFGGPISGITGSVFVVITDTAYSGLPYLLRQRMISAFPGLTRFNDSVDHGRAGLRELKRRFQPVANPVYRARA